MTTGLNNTRTSFAKHDESMREFRKSHGDMALVNLPRSKEPSLLKTTQPMLLSHIGMGAGGLRPPANIMDWAFLVPLHRVASYKLSAN
jgi:hypothetical protein